MAFKDYIGTDGHSIGNTYRLCAQCGQGIYGNQQHTCLPTFTITGTPAKPRTIEDRLTDMEPKIDRALDILARLAEKYLD